MVYGFTPIVTRRGVVPLEGETTNRDDPDGGRMLASLNFTFADVFPGHTPNNGNVMEVYCPSRPLTISTCWGEVPIAHWAKPDHGTTTTLESISQYRIIWCLLLASLS